MSSQSIQIALERFTSFGDLLRFLRRRTGLTQRELSIAVGYSHAQISRLELNQRQPDMAMISARFIPVLDLEDEPLAATRLIELAEQLNVEEMPSPGESPFKGLSYFDEHDAALFRGREKLTLHLVERLRTISLLSSGQRFLAVVGASGSGKSSLVRAGLVPTLRRQPFSSRWRFVTITPTARPLQALAEGVSSDKSSLAEIVALMDDFARDNRALHLFVGKQILSKTKPISSSRQHPQLLLLVDQFEELFTLCQNEDERQAFINNLLTAASEPDGPVWLVIALRSDFYNACAPHPHLREALSGAQEYIGPMNGEELRRAVEEPALNNHWELEPGLVELLLKDLSADANHSPEPGSLPLLSHALLETWQRRHGRTLTVSAYLASGGIRAAIAETADRIYNDELERDQQEIARRIFLRLVQINDNEQAGETRRRATLDELISSAAEESVVREVLTLLADSRLVTTNQNEIELAHEALIREWPTLRSWLDEDREGLLIYRHLSQSAQSWNLLGRDPGELYRGARLSQAQEYVKAHSNQANNLQREFLAASLAQFEREEGQRERELMAAQALAETQRRASQQLRKRALFLLAAFVIAVIMAGIALYQGELVRQSAITAQTNGQIAFSRELSAAALSNLDLDPERSILLGLQAAQVTQSLNGTVLPETEEALHRALVASRVRLTLTGQGQGVLSTAFSPDGKRVAGIGFDGKTIVWDVDTGKKLLELPGSTQVKDSKGVQRIAYSPDGSRLVTGDAQFVKIWDARSGTLIQTLRGHSDDVWAVAFSPDGRLIASSGVDGTLRLWDASSGASLKVFSGFQSPVEILVFSPDGQHVAASSDDPALKVWDVQRGKLLVNRTDLPDVVAVDFSPDGKQIAMGSSAGIELLDATSAEGIPLLTIQDAASWVRFSPDGSHLATANGSVVRLWDAASGRELFTLKGHGGWVMDFAFNPDGTRLASASMDETVKIWSLEPGQEIASMAGSGIRIAYSPGGEWLAQEASGGAVQLWNAKTGAKGLKFGGSGTAILGFSFSPDGKHLAAGGTDKLVRVWNTATGDLLVTLQGHEIGVRDVAYSRDGTRIASAGFDQTARVWDAASGKELLKLEEPQGLMIGVAFSPDGSRLATSSNNGTAKIWDLKTGQLLFTLKGHEAGIPDIAFSPDGKLIATGSQDTTARLWDANTGKELMVLAGHSSEIQSVAFSPDGKMLATGSGDNTAIVWDVTTGQQLHTLFGSSGGVDGVAFDPSGSQIALSSGDGAIRIYTLNQVDLLALAHSRVTGALTTAECQKFLHSSVCPMK